MITPVIAVAVVVTLTSPLILTAIMPVILKHPVRCYLSKSVAAAVATVATIILVKMKLKAMIVIISQAIIIVLVVI